MSDTDAIDVIGLLDSAVELARQAGIPVAGWTMQSSDEGYGVWLYVEQDGVQTSIFDEILVHWTAGASALWCVKTLQALIEGAAVEPDS